MTDDRAWSWLGDAATAVGAPSHTRLWTALRDGRRAELWARVHPLGHEVRCYFCDRFLWAIVVRPDDGRRLDEIVAEQRNAWVGRGWAVTE